MVHPKIIFLDIDGVLCIPPYLKFDEKCMDNLRKIVKATGSKIIVSSSWRTGDLQMTKEAFEEAGMHDDLLSEIIGETCRKYHYTKDGSILKVVRGNEIGTWIDRNLRYPWHENKEMDAQYRVNDEKGNFQKMNSNVTGKHFSYLILDDDSDMLLCQKDWFVQTDGITGLTEKDVETSIEILNSIDNLPEEGESPKERKRNEIYLRTRQNEN